VPAATVTAAGTEATVGAELARATVVPPAGAAPVSVTVPVVSVPPGTVAGLTASAESADVVVVGVQPDKVAAAEVAPSLTVTRQVLDRYPEACTLNRPLVSARPLAVDSGEVTVTVAPARAPFPSTRRLPELSSARCTVVAAHALDGARATVTPAREAIASTRARTRLANIATTPHRHAWRAVSGRHRSAPHPVTNSHSTSQGMNYL
jgi:hypothetical protein